MRIIDQSFPTVARAAPRLAFVSVIILFVLLLGLLTGIFCMLFYFPSLGHTRKLFKLYERFYHYLDGVLGRWTGKGYL